MLEQDLVEAVIGLPANLFQNNSIPSAILLLNAAKSEARRRHVQFVHADDAAFYRELSNQNELTGEGIDHIVRNVKDWTTEERVSRVVPLEEIRENDFNLNIALYVDTTEPEAVDYPGPADKLQLQCASPDGAEPFYLDVYRGRIELTKATHNLRVRTAIPLLRLDLNAAPHINPDGEKVGRTHLHIYREGYGDAWACELPAGVFEDLDDLVRTLHDFMTYCYITRQPTINRGLF